MASPGLTADRTPARLRELSGDVRAALLLDGRGELEAVAGGPEELADEARELLAAVDRIAPAGPPDELEVQFPRGAVYIVRRREWTLAAVAGRGSLSSLVRWDMRAVLAELAR
ncbi:MAG: hypothetical protein ABR581_03870 [Thermoleophilaceae bacterium]